MIGLSISISLESWGGVGGAGPDVGDYLLTEAGDHLILEDGIGHIIL